MGMNILPSMPLRLKIGRYTTKIISSPKMAAFRILMAVLPTRTLRCSWPRVSAWPLLVIWWSTASTTITAPSTIKPKSRAPKLMRLPLTPKAFIRQMANSSDSGMTEATKSPACQLPKNRMSTTMTMSPPSSKFCSTVWMARPTSLLLSKKGSRTTLGGKVFSIWAIRSFTAFTTWLLLAPFSIMTMPPATSPLVL